MRRLTHTGNSVSDDVLKEIDRKGFSITRCGALIKSIAYYNESESKIDCVKCLRLSIHDYDYLQGEGRMLSKKSDIENRLKEVLFNRQIKKVITNL